MPTVTDALRLASAQMYGGEYSEEDIDDYRDVFLQYANEGFRRLWNKWAPLDADALPAAVRLECPVLDADADLGEYPVQMYQPLCDYITWRMFGTNNQTKQARGDWFYARWLEGLGRVKRDENWARTTGGSGSFRGLYDI